MKKVLFIAFVFLCVSMIVKAQSLTITYNNNLTTLIQNGFVGPGVTVTNVSGQLGTTSAGLFTNNGIMNWPYSDGLILSTGDISNLNAPPSNFLSAAQGNSGSSLLDAVVAPLLTHDANVLTFEFATTGDSLEFDFIFASEEYNEFVATPFNDVFGFFITGPGYAPNTNVALIPGTTTPVSINTVNNGMSSGPSSGPCTNCLYYIDNLATPTTYPLAPDGFTSAINVRFPVQPCQTYTFSIAIADVSDEIYDSMVFLKLNSFTLCSNPRVSANGSLWLSDTIPYYLCAGESVILSVPQGANTTWSTGQTGSSISVSQPGQYSAIYTNGNCFSQVSVINVLPADTLVQPNIIFTNDTIFSGYNLPGAVFVWTLNGQPVSGNQNYLPLAGPGCYQLTVYSDQGCNVQSNTWCTPTGIDEPVSSQIKLIPNPASDKTILYTPFESSSKITITIADVSGKIVNSFIAEKGNEIEISTSGFPSGVYFIESLNSSNGKAFHTRLIVE